MEVRAVRKRHTGAILTCGVICNVLVAVATLVVNGSGVEGWHEATRVTARFSLLIFLIVFITGPLARTFPSQFFRVILIERRGLGLSFAGAHTVHLCVFVAYYVLGGVPPQTLVFAMEGVGYALIVLMALTSNDAAVAWLGPRNWRWLHTIGVYYIWAVFAAIYAVRIGLAFGALLFDLLFALLLLALLIRVGAATSRNCRTRTKAGRG